MPNGYDELFTAAWYLENVLMYCESLLDTQKKILVSMKDFGLHGPELRLRMENLLDETEALAKHARAVYRKARPRIVEMNVSMAKRGIDHSGAPHDEKVIDTRLEALKAKISAHRKSVKDLERKRRKN
jgi:hypothetical protein